MIEVWCDGACEPVNPGGWGGYGALIRKDGEVLAEISGLIERRPSTSNNVAEYRAFLEALRWLDREGMAGEEILVRGDSKLVINQMFGRWRIKQGHYVRLALAAKDLLKQFSAISGRWVPREENGPADELSKRELLKVLGGRLRIQPEYEEPSLDQQFKDAMERSE